jgi:outer membrane immunogenic protein
MRMPAKAAPPPIVLSWTGCYIGVNAGGGFSNKHFTDPLVPPGAGELGSHRGNGVEVGGQVGCDYQFGTWVVGVRGLWDASNIRGDSPVPPLPFADVITSKINWFATATGRVGYTVTPSVLVYATGGAAWVRDTFSIVDGGILEAQATPTRSGWVAGFGVDFLTQDGWSMFVEYNYMGFGRKQTTFTNLEAPPIPPTFPIDVYQSVQTVMVGFNTRFGSAAPVVAKF